MENLQKCIDTWKDVFGKDKKLSKGFCELIVATITNLEELQKITNKESYLCFDVKCPNREVEDKW